MKIILQGVISTEDIHHITKEFTLTKGPEEAVISMDKKASTDQYIQFFDGGYHQPPSSKYYRLAWLKEATDLIEAEIVVHSESDLTIGILIMQYDKIKILSNEQKKIKLGKGENRISFRVGRYSNADTFKVRLNLGVKPCKVKIFKGTVRQIEAISLKYAELYRLERRKKQIMMMKDGLDIEKENVHILNPIGPDYDYSKDRDGNDVLVSIIVPVYNTGVYLPRCLDSLLGQTVKDIEIIAVNDGSKDDSLTILKNYQQKYPSIIKIIDKENGGLGMARNRGLKIARGRFVMFLDSDDAYAVDALESLYWESIKFDCDMVYGRIGLEIDGQLVPQENLEKKLSKHLGRRYSNLRQDTGTIFYNVVCTLYKRELLENNGIRFPEGILWEDMPFAIQAWNHSKMIGYVPNIVYYRTMREDSLSRKANYRQVKDRIVVTELINDYFNKYNIHNMFNYFKWSIDDIEERINQIESNDDKERALRLWTKEKPKLIERKNHHEYLHNRANRSMVEMLLTQSFRYFRIKRS
jgi:glycosyltransferase involved in cell wall biosynthesis